MELSVREIGVAQAEAFRQYRGHPYPQDNLLHCFRTVGQDGAAAGARSASRSR